MKVCNVTKIFADSSSELFTALDDISFEIEKGSVAMIAGSNGSGKSVLMSLIAGLDKPSKGSIDLEGEDCGLVFQEADSAILGETVFEDVSFGAKNIGLKKEELKNAVEGSLEQVGLLHKKESQARTLSGGQKRRLAVAGILAMDKSLFIFDEPFANLDYPGVKNVCRILKQLKEQGKTLIILTHEIEKCLALCDRFIVLDKGKICFDGTALEGLKEDLEKWSIRKPSEKLEKLLWL
ncbi:MAG: energy-coupling factor ABC transporter ATP-binding protein [Treponema sp.]|nr:energy-coupling factor ABC transporter ATP-binding protein [Treponema sp.]